MKSWIRLYMVMFLLVSLSQTFWFQNFTAAWATFGTAVILHFIGWLREELLEKNNG